MWSSLDHGRWWRSTKESTDRNHDGSVDRDDDFVLAAVEFLHAGTEGADANLFADEDANPPPRTLEEEGWHFVEEADVTALHVWVPHWNPVGVFHPTNPAVENQPGVGHHF